MITGAGFGDTFNWVTGSTIDASSVDANYKETQSSTQGPTGGLFFTGVSITLFFQSKNKASIFSYFFYFHFKLIPEWSFYHPNCLF